MKDALLEKGASVNSARSNYNTPLIDEILNKLAKVKRVSNDRWTACCPAHDDKHPSLAIRDNNGIILLKCFGGCNAHEIVSAIGLNLSDLFPPTDDPKYIKQTRQGFSAWQLLNVLQSDLDRLLIITNDLKSIEALSSDDRDFVADVVLRLNDGISYLEGNQ